jgi:tRNA pseudouridine38-40 synthase
MSAAIRATGTSGAARASRVVRLLIAYDGTNFRGWARQRGDRVRTVQGTLEAALGRVLRDEPSLVVAGRTDAGVHARGQVASFEATADTDLDRVRRGVNALIGPEVVVRRVDFAQAGFHARHSATAREYTYRMNTGPTPDPFTARFVWHREGSLSISSMRIAARPLVGEHDFAAFCRRADDGGTVRRLERIAIRRSGDLIELTLRANAFCHQMVRSLAGLLVAAGEGRIASSESAAILSAGDRSRAGQLVPPHGLTLERVTYGPLGRRPRGAASDPSGAGRGVAGTLPSFDAPYRRR